MRVVDRQLAMPRSRSPRDLAERGRVVRSAQTEDERAAGREMMIPNRPIWPTMLFIGVLLAALVFLLGRCSA
jgi:hypothetical protein